MAYIIPLRDRRTKVEHKIRFSVHQEHGTYALWVWETGHFSRAHWSTIGSCSIRMVMHPLRGALVIGVKIRDAPSHLRQYMDEFYKVSYLLTQALSKDTDTRLSSRDIMTLTAHYSRASTWLIKHFDPTLPKSVLLELQKHRHLITR